MNLATALTESGCNLDSQAFRDLVRSIFVEKYPAMTDEDVYCRPAEAMLFCNHVRRGARAPQIADELVLRTLTNIRKRGELPRLKDRRSTPEPKQARVESRPAPKVRIRRTDQKAVHAIQL